MIPQCPACHESLKKIPQRKTKCPACGNVIHVKRVPGESEKRLVTETQAAEIDKQWELQGARERYACILNAHGIGKSQYENAIREIEKKGPLDSACWQAAHDLFQARLDKEDDLNTRKMLYYNLASLRDEKDLEYHSLLCKVAETELEHYRQSHGAVIAVEVRNSGLPTTCEACRRNAGKRMSLEEAMKNSPLPCEGCTCLGTGKVTGFCRCHFYPIFRSE